MSVKIQFRRGTATQWTSANTILSIGEPGYESDTGKFKIGDGTTAWSALPYESDTGGSGGTTTVDVGSTTTGAPGTNALVVNSGTTTDAVFDFTIPRGSAGTPGADGQTVLSGSVPPTNGVGANGDFYINTSTWTIYGPKAAGVWPSGHSLVGPGGAGSGDVVGPASATDHGVATFNSTTGKLIQDSPVTITSSGLITAPKVGNIIPFYFANQAAFPSASTYEGAVALSDADTKLYFANNGSWVALAKATDVITYGISAETTTGGVNLRLTGSDAGIDNVKFAEGSNITLTRTDANTITIASTATGGSSTLDGLDDVVITTAISGQVLKFNGTNWVNGTDATGGGGGSMASRSTASVTTTSIANNASTNVSITAGFKTYALLKITTDHPAWVRVYTDGASRTADSSRSQGTDPTAGSGVIAEAITSASPQTVLVSPGTIGFSNETSPSTNIELAVTNLSGATRTITVTLTIVQLEA